MQDTGEIQAVSEAGQTVSFAKMAQLQQQTRRDDPQETPSVDSLSSFIGVDGTNTTLNSGRIQINLKPLNKRDSVTAGHSGSSRDAARRISTASSLYMQPVQDISVEDIVSRTEYQFSMQDPNASMSSRITRSSFVDRS